jgi:hypothetical protein
VVRNWTADSGVLRVWELSVPVEKSCSRSRSASAGDGSAGSFLTGAVESIDGRSRSGSRSNDVQAWTGATAFAVAVTLAARAAFFSGRGAGNPLNNRCGSDRISCAAVRLQPERSYTRSPGCLPARRENR